MKVTVVSAIRAREAVAAILGPGRFFGEACTGGAQVLRLVTVSAMTDAVVARIEKPHNAGYRLVQEQPAFSQMFMTAILNRTIRVEADLIDQLVQFQ